MTARYAVRVSPADVGRRVSVRSRLASQETGPPAVRGPTMTDTVGHLRSWREGVLEIERSDGSLTRIAESDLVAGRVIRRLPPGEHAHDRRASTRPSTWRPG